MKNVSLFFILFVFSFPSLAVVNGTSLTWSDYDNVVQLNNAATSESGKCTGMVIAGHYVLTAGHCVSQIDSVQLNNGTTLTSYSANMMAANPSLGNDVALLDTSRIDSRHVNYLIKTNPYLDAGQAMTIAGFGGTPGSLNRANFTISSDNARYGTETLEADTVDSSHTTGGDSGSAWLNANSEIIAVHKGSIDDPIFGRDTYSTNLYYARSFLKSTIDGWHYPTLAYSSNNSVTITVQSIHQNTVADSAYTNGAYTITGGTCWGNNSIGAFDTCTYELSGSGEGYLYLTNSEYVHINKPATNTSSSEFNEAGGSAGAITLALLVGLGIIRRRNHRPKR